MTNPVPASHEAIESLLHDAKLQIKADDLSSAVSILQQLLSIKPSHRDALYYLAVCQRKMQDNTAAMATLKQLTAEHPTYGRAFQEQGHNYSVLQDKQAASSAFEQAISLNPALEASWKALVLHYDAIGQKEKAQEAMRHAHSLAQLPPPLRSVSSLIHEDKLYMAEQICRQFLQNNKHHPDAMRLLAEIGTRMQILDDAELLLEKCVEFYPDNLRARMDYVQVLHKRQKFEKALEQAKELHRADPSNIAFEISLASATQAVGEFDQALSIYDRVIARSKNQHTVHSARGHALKTIGRTDEAIQAYRTAYSNKTDFGDAYWSLANLKTYTFTQDEISTMRDQEQRHSTSSNDKIHLCFALGKALEDRQNYAESFEFYQRGNALKQQQSNYDPARLEREFEIQKQLFDAGFFEANEGSGYIAADPIFIVGLPRAGSTLLEQILASHSQIDGTMELANIIGLAHRLGGRRTNRQAARYPAILTELNTGELQSFGEKFIEDTRIHRQGAAYFIDKMPNNFRHIPLIRLILPNAKIIDARREPMACCFSGFKQLFAEGQEFSYGLDSIGRYYRSYVELMNHWDKVMPGRILRVQHEDVIDDLEGQVHKILAHCGLPFEQACVDFHKTQRAVRTPSSEQVRQPIFKSGMEQWQNYKQFLQPLVSALGPEHQP